jgi:adenine-specific DNA-methyltransferase
MRCTANERLIGEVFHCGASPGCRCQMLPYNAGMSSTPLSDTLDTDRRALSDRLPQHSRKALGQFMTPANIAQFMASLFRPTRSGIALLDAGAGMGSLLAACVDRLCQSASPVRQLAITAVEIDSLLAGRLRCTLDACSRRCRDTSRELSATLIESDFIDYAWNLAKRHAGVAGELERFDAAILNPPYAKIRADSKHRRQLRDLGIEATNLYSAFLALAILMLRPGGELVAIVPRSFCNGPYFRAFRRQLTSAMSLRRIHIYESRSAAFSDDEVLQENVILHAVKDPHPPAHVVISSSAPASQAAISIREVPWRRVVRPDDPHAFINIPTAEDGHVISDFVLQQPCTLEQLGLLVSTGRVVDFRSREHLRDMPQGRCVPLIYPAHFQQGFVQWPRPGHKKPNAIASNAETRNLLVPNETYVLIRRFTSKEEARRLVACIHDPSRLPGAHRSVGFENHLNYFHAAGRGLPPLLARGLAAWLNSTMVDRHFRQFSGHTQVNATDLRSLRYPQRATLERIADRLGERIDDQAAIDAVVAGQSTPA